MNRRAPYGELVRQYLDLRDDHPGVIILFRVGSFYEVLFEDAELVSRELGLKLGERPSGGAAAPVSQCGFAHHALDTFLPRLLARGYRVAVCEEREEEPDRQLRARRPERRQSGGSGSIRQRDVVRTLTPGTVTDPRLLARGSPDLPRGDCAAGRPRRAGLDRRRGRRVQGRRTGPGRGRRRAAASGAGRGDRLGGSTRA